VTKFGVIFLVLLAGAALAGLAQPRSEGRAAVDGPATRLFLYVSPFTTSFAGG
jgi:hypothetical protein